MRLAVALVVVGALTAAVTYQEEIAAWQKNRAARLTADDGWTTVAGLYWLKPGVNKFASLAAPVEFVLEGKRVTAKYQGQAIALRPDTSNADDKLKHGTLTMNVIERAGQFGVRVRDTASKYRREFKGLKYFPVSRNYRVEAKWVPYATPKKVVVNTVIDHVKEGFEAPGQAEFVLNGKTLRLEPVVDEGELFFIFRDATAGKQTYGAGRFLYTEMPKNGRVTIDFNKAYNPPCAFTPYATCPLPLPQNKLAVAIEAGELAYHLE